MARFFDPKAAQNPLCSAKVPGNCRTQQLERLQEFAGICRRLRETAGDPPERETTQTCLWRGLLRETHAPNSCSVGGCGRLRETAGDLRETSETLRRLSVCTWSEFRNKRENRAKSHERSGARPFSGKTGSSTARQGTGTQACQGTQAHSQLSSKNTGVAIIHQVAEALQDAWGHAPGVRQ